MNLPHQVLRNAAATLLLTLTIGSAATDKASYQQSVEKWRQDYQTTLTSEEGWLTVAGLFWLHEGQNKFGSAAGNDIVLPAGAPAAAGYFDFHAGKTAVHLNQGVSAAWVQTKTPNTNPIEGAALEPDSRQDRLVISGLVLYVHKSGDRFAIRMKDKNSKLRKEFHGLKWFPVNDAYRVIARYEPYPAPKQVEIQTVLGDKEHLTVAGQVIFTLNGKEYRLEGEKDDSGEMEFVFRDLTSAKDTYPAARFLDTDAPKDGKVELDFNKAYNPPCAYNPYTTCPLPVPGNRLQVEIPAGEKRYHE
jgi:uncharacterized protein